MLYVNYISIKLEKKIIKKRKKPVCYIFGIHQRPKGTRYSAASSSATHLGRKRTAYLLATWPRLSALALAAKGNSTHLHQHQEDQIPAGSHFIFMRHLDEEITEDFFFSPKLCPRLTASLQDHCWMLTGQVLKEMLPFSYWFLLTWTLPPAGSEPEGPGGHQLPENQKLPHEPRCTAHLSLTPHRIHVMPYI